MFSVGYILHEMLTGKELTAGITTPQELSLFLRTKKKDGGFNFDHIPTWKPILRKLLDFEPESRASFVEIQDMLKDFKPSTSALPLPSLSSG